MTLKTQ